MTILESNNLRLPILIFLTFVSTNVFASNKNKIGEAHLPIYVKAKTSNLQPSGFTPTQIRNAYGFSYFASQGEGQTIAIIDAYDHPNIENDLNVFSNTFGLPSCTTQNGCFAKIYADGKQPPVDALWALETALDVEWAHAIAPRARILLVEAADGNVDSLMNAVRVALNVGVNCISMSWGWFEFVGETNYDNLFNTPNVTFVASSGDNGSKALYPAAHPNVLSIGGTVLSLDASGNYLEEVAWEGSSGGLSIYQSEPSYQLGYPLPNNSAQKRGIPDVSYNSVNYPIYDTVPFNGQSGWLEVGGTSAAAPQWAALIAVANSGRTQRLTNVHNALYQLSKQFNCIDYNDITKGTNGTCGYYCTAQIDYDYVTGLGTPKLNLLYDLLKV